MIEHVGVRHETIHVNRIDCNSELSRNNDKTSPHEFVVRKLRKLFNMSANAVATNPMAPKTRCPVMSMTIIDVNMRIAMSS